jgi:formate--tetrahydrofolate ligase
MKKLDPTKMQDWEIACEAESAMKTIDQLGDELGIDKMELMPYGHYVGKINYMLLDKRLGHRPRGKYIVVTAITPTPLGEGKTTTTIGLVQGLGHLGKKVIGAIRQPSGGPTFNIKGSAAGGGLSQCIPLADFSLGLTGDIDAVTNAHNLAMVALTSRIQHEFNYTDDFLKKRGLRRLNINPKTATMGWAMDFCAQSLRNIIIGLGGPTDGFMMESSFQIAVSSEVMAILAIAKDLKDMRERIAKIIIACDTAGRYITTRDLEVDGAMTALMARAINPNLMQTIEGQPMLVHAGPFANIAIGQSSIIADRLGMKLADYHVTESGFGADIGYEKFWNLKCRYSGYAPDCAVIVCTIRALKMHGGGPQVLPGKPLDPAYTRQNLGLLEKGADNLLAHIAIVKKSGVMPVVCINHFYTDTDEEIALIKGIAEKAGARVAVSKHWEKGGTGAAELAQAVIDACAEPGGFKFLYNEETMLHSRIELIAREVYGADGVEYLPEARNMVRKIEDDPELSRLHTCMVKTHLSLSHNPLLKGRPRGWTLPIRNILIFGGAGFIVPVTGDINLLPGTGSDPAFRRIDVDTKKGKITGLF